MSLNSAAPLLSSLVFNDATAGYSIVQGSGTTGLTLASSDSGSPAVVTVLSGTHSVLAPILLNSNLEVSSSGSLTLGGNIDDGGLGQGLTLAGSGTLILSGTNTFGGGTVVVGGVLDLANRTSLLDGSSLTVGADAASIFAPSLSLAPALTPAAVPAPVPEPSALALLATAAAGCAGVWSGCCGRPGCPGAGETPAPPVLERPPHVSLSRFRRLSRGFADRHARPGLA